MAVKNERTHSLLAACKKLADLFGENGLLKLLTKKLVARALQSEMGELPGHATSDPIDNPTANTRNSKKTTKWDYCGVIIEIPRDRHNSIELQIVIKSHTRRADFEGKILSLCAFGMTAREIQSHPQETHGAQISPEPGPFRPSSLRSDEVHSAVASTTLSL